MQMTLDITRDHCPMTFVKVKLGLARLAKGDILDVLLEGEEPLANIPRAAVEQGHIVLETSQVDGRHRILIQKG
jgi:TusA-related sulfurtransferase